MIAGIKPMADIPYAPSKSEIRRMCREIQRNWTLAEERNRRGVRGNPYYECLRVPPAVLRSGRMTDLERMEESNR